MNREQKMTRIIETARGMEENDNHVTNSSRKRIVYWYMEVFKDYDVIMFAFPYEQDFTDRFVWIVYEG